MVKEFNYLSFISSLLKLSPRQLGGETRTANFLASFLRKNKVDYHQQYFFAKVPKIEKAILNADKAKIPCQGCSFVGGEIVGKDSILSSLVPSRFFLEKSNINFNPECQDISCSNFYFAPSLAVSAASLPLIIKAKNVRGEVKVDPVKYKAVNILVGNKDTPRFIFFAHYDSINSGAVDNASGVAILMDIIVNYPATLKNSLFVFSANEELSYDKPTYWGHGFRIFEASYLNLFEKAEKIIAVDCVGNGIPHLVNKLDTLRLAFPINNLGKFQKKTFTIHGDIKKLMQVYHSDLDDISQLNEKFLKQTSNLILKKVYAN